MMNIFNRILNDICRVIREQYGDSLNLKGMVVEYPKNESYGDLATNAAIILAKQLNQPAKEIAERIIPRLLEDQNYTRCEIAGAGFINIFCSNDFWQDGLSKMLEQGMDYGKCNIGCGKKINIEFVSANPTGPMHIGHARGAIYGDALASLLEFVGFDVTKEFYINDYGAQIDILAESLLMRYREALGMDVTIPDGYYPGEYLITLGEDLKKQYGDKLFTPDPAQKEMIKTFAVDKMMEMIKADLAALGVTHDIFISEKFDIVERKKNEEAFEFLQSKGLIYRGILDVPKGKKPEDWEPREQELFKSTLFGDDIDRPLKKSDGSFAYFASDIAYHMDKLRRGFDELILVLGSDHIGYVKRIKAVVSALSDNKMALDVRINQLVNLLKDGEPYKMSKRSGNFITVTHMVEEVGKDILRFLMLSRKADTLLEIDFTKAKEQTKENPVFYVQYAHTRASSALQKALELGEIGLDNPSKIDFSYLTRAEEIRLIKQILLFPKIIEVSAITHEPHRITFYLYDLASALHALWTRGMEHEDSRLVIPHNLPLTCARLGVILATKNTLFIGLSLLKIRALEKM